VDLVLVLLLVASVSLVPGPKDNLERPEIFLLLWLLDLLLESLDKYLLETFHYDMLFDNAYAINALFRPEDGAPLRLVDKIAWHIEVDKDALTDKLFHTLVHDEKGNFITLSPLGVLCAGRKYIEEDAVRRSIAIYIDWAMQCNEKLMEDFVMNTGPLLLSMGHDDDPTSSPERQDALKLLESTKDVWQWMVKAYQGTWEYEDIADYDAVAKQAMDDAIIGLYENVSMQ
jgi:hypothetical protein